MARSLKSAARTTTTTSVQESAPVPLQGQWPTAAFAAVSAALTYAVRPCETLLELQDIYKPLAPRLESPKTQVAVLPLSWKNTTLSVYQNQQFDAIFAVDLADLVNNPQNLVTDFYRIVNKCKMFVNITTRVVPTDSSNHMAVGWETILKRNQVASAFKLTKPPAEALDEALLANGASLKKLDGNETRIDVCRWLEPASPRTQLNFIATQSYKAPIPAEIYTRCVNDYERWLKAQYSDLDTRMEAYFEISMRVWHW